MPGQLVRTDAVAENIMSVTRPLWRKRPGDVGETMDQAFKRLFHEPMGIPLLFQWIKYEGRDVVVRLHVKGRVTVLDASAGEHQIRLLHRREVERCINAAMLLKQNRVRPDVGDAAIRFIQARGG